jgi:hypothetical protein
LIYYVLEKASDFDFDFDFDAVKYRARFWCKMSESAWSVQRNKFRNTGRSGTSETDGSNLVFDAL